RLAVVVGGPKKAVHRGAHVTLLLLGNATLGVGIGDRDPFAVPGLVVPRDHARGGQEALAHGAPAFLRLADAAAKLIRQPRVLGPVVPTKGLVVGLLVGGDLGNDVVLAQDLVVGTGHGAPPESGDTVRPPS